MGKEGEGQENAQDGDNMRLENKRESVYCMYSFARARAREKHNTGIHNLQTFLYFLPYG